MRKQIQPVSAASGMRLESSAILTLVDEEPESRTYLARSFPTRVYIESQTALQNLKTHVAHQ